MERDHSRHAERRGDLSRLARGGAINLVGLLVNAVLAFAITIVVARGLGAGRAGVLFEAVAVFAILTNALELGADTGLVRLIPKHRANGRTQDLRRTLIVGLSPVFVMGALAGVALFAFAPQLSRVLASGTRPDALVPYLRVLAFFVPLSSCVAVTLAGTRGFGTMVPASLTQNLVMPGTRLALLSIAVAAGLGSASVALAWSASIVPGLAVGLVALLALLRRAERGDRREPGPPRGRAALAGEFWRFTIPRAFSAIFATTTLWLDTLLLGALRSTREAGIYAATNRYIIVGAFALQASILVIGPQISSLLTQGDHRRAESVYRSATWWVMLASWPIFLAFTVFAPVFLRVFGEQFAPGQSVLLIRSLSLLAGVATGPVAMVLLMGGRSTLHLLSTLASLVLNVVLNLILIPRLGMDGAAFAWAASTVFINSLLLAQVWRNLKLHPLGAGFVAAAASAVACYGVVGLAVRLTLGASIPAFLLYGALATGLYTALLWRFRHVLELSHVREVFRRGSREPAIAPEPSET
ncbi:MAG: oligosaccharide flippase family protein [Actinomycetota bacterium]